MDISDIPKPTTIIVGCAHEVQGAKPHPTTEDEQQQFRQLITELIRRHGIRFIGEEFKQGGEAEKAGGSIAQEVAAAHGVTYEPIDIPLPIQEGIKRRSTFDFDPATGGKDVTYSNEYCVAWNLVREYHMFQSFQDAQITLDPGAKPALLICGRWHLPRVQKLLVERRWLVIPICFGGKKGDPYCPAGEHQHLTI